MNVLLTGATGFIGSHVARVLLEHGHTVHALVRPASRLERITDIRSRLNLCHGDLLDQAFSIQQLAPMSPSGSAFGICLHLAWCVEPGRYAESPLNRNYVRASLRLADQLSQAGCQRLVGAGTCYEYDLTGAGGSGVPAATGQITEADRTRPTTLYGQCKLELFEKLQQLDMPVAWPRLFYQYGPHEDPRRLVPYIVQSLLRGQPAELTPGEQVRDFLHLEDVARAIVAVAESGLTGAVNIGSGQPVTVRQLAEKIGALLGRPDLLRFGARPYPADEPMRSVADNARLRSTGWQPRYDLDSGLREAIDWWRTKS